jgi:hypothetical protein
MTPGLAVFKLAFQLSPILLCNGIATDIPGGVLPIIAITEASHFVLGLLSGTDNIELDNFFAHYHPMPGSTLVDNQVGTYPFANQAVAANAIISQPLRLSMMMHCPARDILGYPNKLVTMMALKAVLDKHSSLGGTYTVVTPVYPYTNGILTRVTDVSDGGSKQAQNAYQLDFEFPLLTLETAQSVQNSLLNKLDGGTQVNATNGAVPWSGLSTGVGQPDTLFGSSVIPAASGLSAATTAPFAGGLA